MLFKIQMAVHVNNSINIIISFRMVKILNSYIGTYDIITILNTTIYSIEVVTLQIRLPFRIIVHLNPFVFFHYFVCDISLLYN